MIVIPAIDLKGGRCVRLRQGRAAEETVYGDDPVAMARHWVEEGAEYLHVVDLDGAFEGRPVHHATIARIVAAIDVPVETGGGLRTDGDVRLLLEAGARRVIVGTRACRNPDELRALAGAFGPQLVVGIDAREGFVQVSGWTETTDVTAVDLATRVEQMGVCTVIYTDTSTDGMLRGHNVGRTREMCKALDCAVVASGGVSSVQDVAALRVLHAANLEGVIVGKALYEGRVSLASLADAAGRTG